MAAFLVALCALAAAVPFAASQTGLPDLSAVLKQDSVGLSGNNEMLKLPQMPDAFKFDQQSNALSGNMLQAASLPAGKIDQDSKAQSINQLQFQMDGSQALKGGSGTFPEDIFKQQSTAQSINKLVIGTDDTNQADRRRQTPSSANSGASGIPDIMTGSTPATGSASRGSHGGSSEGLNSRPTQRSSPGQTTHNPVGHSLPKRAGPATPNGRRLLATE